MKEMSCTEEIEIMIRARYPVIYLLSWEEKRVETDLLKIAQAMEKQIFSWSVTQGLINLSTAKSSLIISESTKDPLSGLENIQRAHEPGIYIIKDFHHYLDEAPVIRKMRDLTISLRSTFKTVIILSPILKIPPELEKDIYVIEYDLPGNNELENLLNRLISSIQNSRKNIEIKIDQAGKEKLLQAMRGLTISEAENVFARMIVSQKRLSPEDLSIIHSEKKQIIKKNGLLEFYPTQENISDVGGLKNLKNWLKKRSSAFSENAREYGLPQPKGILLLGVSGSGKSLVAKAISSLWQLPLLRLDIGNLFSSLVGSSEENMRKVLRAAEAVAPCLLWLDEIDKGFSGSSSSNFSDGGTTARVLSGFLSWMKEKQSPVFIIATANDISFLPPELLRKGRFDEIFFLDLPEKEERKDIIDIHLQKRGRKPENFAVENLASMTESFSGAEIEQAIIAAMYDSFEEERELRTEDIVIAIKNSVPLAQTMKENIEQLRNWARTRARGASGG